MATLVRRGKRMYSKLMEHSAPANENTALIEAAGDVAERFDVVVTGIAAPRPTSRMFGERPLASEVIDRDPAGNTSVSPPWRGHFGAAAPDRFGGLQWCLQGFKLKMVSCLLAMALVCSSAQAGGHAIFNPGFDGAAIGDRVPGQTASPQAADRGSDTPQSRCNFALPAPALTGTHSLARLLMQRRSVREFATTPLALEELGQLLWAAQGITTDDNLRTAPSAGALYPLELYVVAGNVKGLPAGIYRYDPHGHRLGVVKRSDQRQALAAAALQQSWLAAAPVVVVFGAVHLRTSTKYRDRASRYVSIELGAASENLFLQAGDLGLGTVIVGAFDDGTVRHVLRLPAEVAPLVLMPVGVPARTLKPRVSGDAPGGSGRRRPAYACAQAM